MRLLTEHRYEIAYYIKNTIANGHETVDYKLGISTPYMKCNFYDKIEIFFDNEKYKDHQCDQSDTMKRILSDVLHANAIDIYDRIKDGKYVIYYELKKNIFSKNFMQLEICIRIVDRYKTLDVKVPSFYFFFPYILLFERKRFIIKQEICFYGRK